MQQDNTEREYTADDRDPNDAFGRLSLAALLVLWEERDVRYAQNNVVLTPSRVAAIRQWREQEASELAPKDRAKAWALAHAWNR